MSRQQSKDDKLLLSTNKEVVQSLLDRLLKLARLNALPFAFIKNLLTLNKDVDVITTIILENNGVSHKTCCNLCDNRSVKRAETRPTESKGKHTISEPATPSPKKLRSCIKRTSCLDSSSNNDASYELPIHNTNSTFPTSSKFENYACIICTEAADKSNFSLAEKMVKHGSNLVRPLADNLRHWATKTRNNGVLTRH